MNTTADTITPVSVHFDDCDWSFPALQDASGDLFVTDETYRQLQSDGHIDGENDFAPKVVGDLRLISNWDINFDVELSDIELV